MVGISKVENTKIARARRIRNLCLQFILKGEGCVSEVDFVQLVSNLHC